MAKNTYIYGTGYVTGGKARSFYRDKEGVCHTVGDPNEKPSKRNRQYAPYLVFKK